MIYKHYELLAELKTTGKNILVREFSLTVFNCSFELTSKTKSSRVQNLNFID
ncbi:MAG: hypothetical protein MAG581_01354 [Deltaproteobacteria bacterium]|jgi:hypothetical protein|nr:hypothetical protein [Deltaproteobacteria bacterium]